jgi:hypothetical protein
MRYLMIILAATAMATGCSKSSPPHPGVQINDSLMSISANPIEGKPVTFWHSLAEPRKELLREALAWRCGPPGITLTPRGRDPIILSDVEVSDARVTRKVMVKQGTAVLYTAEWDVTQENLERLCSCTVDSTEWQDIPLTDEDIAFSVDYWRYYETEYGKGGYSIISDLVLIPVRKE